MYESHECETDDTDETTALAAAIHYLRRSTHTEGTEWIDLCQNRTQREWQALHHWAQITQRCLSDDFLNERAECRGSEHSVWFEERDQRYHKATHADRCGWKVGLKSGELVVQEASPLFYLQRLVWCNQLFGDDIVLEGLCSGEDVWHIVTSQPALRGKLPDLAEIRATFADMGFRELPGFTIGAATSLSFYRQRGKFLVTDAHPDNFIKLREMTLPIDLVVQRAGPYLDAAINKRFPVRL